MLSISRLLPQYFDPQKKLSSEVWGKDLAFNAGDYTNIIAPSGSGKTSLMHFLYGLRSSYEGDILYDNRNFRSFSHEDVAAYRREKISIVLQDLRLFPDQTVLQNLELKRQLTSFHPPEMITVMAERLGISSRLNQLCKICSYGEQQRVAIIRALLQPYHILLLDEPFSHLDRTNASIAMQLMLEETQARKASIIFADLEHIDIFPSTRILHL